MKMKAISIATGVGAGLMLLTGVAHAELIDLPATAVADVSGYATSIFTDLWVVIALVIGIPLAFYVIRKVIGLFRSR